MNPPTPEFCLFAVNWWPLCMTKAEWSGWVQAIGSIAAILAGFFFVRWQINLAREDRISERVWQDLDSLEALNGSTFLLATRMSACGDQWQEGRHISEAQMTDLRSAFQVVGETQKPIFLPSRALSDWLAVQVHAAAGMAHIESVYAAAKLGLKVVPQTEVAALFSDRACAVESRTGHRWMRSNYRQPSLRTELACPWPSSAIAGQNHPAECLWCSRARAAVPTYRRESLCGFTPKAGG